MLHEAAGRMRQDKQADKMKRLHREGLNVEAGTIVTVRVPKEQRSRTSSQGVLGVIYSVSKVGSVKVASSNGIISGGSPAVPIWLSSDEWSTVDLMPNQLEGMLKKRFDKIITGKFKPEEEPLVSLKKAQKLMLGHEIVGVTRCTCKKMCISLACKCRRFNTICGSGCGCGGKCDHSKNLTSIASSQVTEPPSKKKKISPVGGN